MIVPDFGGELHSSLDDEGFLWMCGHARLLLHHEGAENKQTHLVSSCSCHSCLWQAVYTPEACVCHLSMCRWRRRSCLYTCRCSQPFGDNVQNTGLHRYEVVKPHKLFTVPLDEVIDEVFNSLLQLRFLQRDRVTLIRDLHDQLPQFVQLTLDMEETLDRQRQPEKGRVRGRESERASSWLQGEKKGGNTNQSRVWPTSLLHWVTQCTVNN